MVHHHFAMPALTINSQNNTSGSESPPRPPISPITPPLGPTHLPGDGGDGEDVEMTNSGGSSTASMSGQAQATASQQQQQRGGNPFARQTFTHSQPDQIGIPPPSPVPISFESNPDVIALKAAISVLQIQKMRATSDVQALSKAKSEALENPAEFIQDLLSGKVKSSDGFIDDEPGEGSSSSSSSSSARAWHSLPKPQDIVRCPPINWSQYVVVGESLDKLHAEQVASPTQGTPASIGAGGMYEFKGGQGKQETYKGVASPYSPFEDKIDRKPNPRT